MRKVGTLTPFVIKFLIVNGLDPKRVKMQLLRGEIEIEIHNDRFVYIRRGGRDLKFPFIIIKKQETKSNGWEEGIHAIERLKPHYHEEVNIIGNNDCCADCSCEISGNSRD